jgi:hypothetical protein
METPEIEHQHPHHTGRPWVDLVLGICAVSISFISLFLAIANGKAMDRLVQANSWPFVQITYSNVNPDGTPHIHLDIANKGVGPALIESLAVEYRGVPVRDPRAMLNAILKRTTAPPHPRIISSSVVHSVLAAKELISFVEFSPQEFSAEDYATIGAGVQALRFVACYCSVFDECWVVDTQDARKIRPPKVKECPSSQNAFEL